MLENELVERLAAKERYVAELERQLNIVMNENRMLKAALDALRDL